MNTYNWQSASGRWHEFEVVRAQRAWEQVGGVYVFVKPHEAQLLWGGPTPLYIAKTDNFAAALARHDMWAAAESMGAREIHILPIKDEQTRTRLLNDLLEAQKPILNRNMLQRAA